jgi:uncharacterized membrane protein
VLKALRTGPYAERIRHTWEQVRANALFVPGSLIAAAAVLAFALLAVDKSAEREVIDFIPWLFTGGPDGAQQVLSTIAGSMVTLAGVTFSIITVALSLASQQFGPRLLRNFANDLINQAMLGAFIATFVYCLLVLREVRLIEDDTFVPYLAVTVGVVLALATMVLFVYFIHHVIDSIQGSAIIARSARETMATIDSLFPASVGEPADGMGEPEPEIPPLSDAHTIRAHRTGYLQAVDTKKLIDAAREWDVVFRMEIPIGAFVAEGTPLFTAGPGSRVSEETGDAALDAVSIGRHRSMPQDPEFGPRQLVDIAVRALSPGVNDPTTAVYCIDYLAAILVHLARRDIPSNLRLDDDGELRLITAGTTFEGMADLAFNQIRQYARTDVAATFRLLEMIGQVGRETHADHQRDVLDRHLRKIARGAAEGITDPADRIEFNERLAEAAERIDRPATAERYRLSSRPDEGLAPA